LAVHTGAPVVQVIPPVRHGLPVRVQAVPTTQSLQMPSLQTLFSPQAVPLGWDCCVSVQEAPEAAQAVCPT
jgi:hypothetical protein